MLADSTDVIAIGSALAYLRFHYGKHATASINRITKTKTQLLHCTMPYKWGNM